MAENGGTEIFIRLYLDEDLSKKVAVALRARGFDVISAHEINKLGLTDDQQLEIAVSQGRCLLTFNAPDYFGLHFEYISSQKGHWGIIISDQASLKELIKRISKLLNNIQRDEMKNQILYLQAFK